MQSLLVACLGFSLLFVTTLSHAAPEPRPWLVEELRGEVYVRQLSEAGDDHAKPVLSHAVLWAPFELMTGPGAQVVLRRAQERISLSANTVIEVHAEQSVPEGVLARVRQLLGKALFEVERLPSRGFEVETPFLVSVVKGTTFTVIVGRQAALVALAEGRLLVQDAQRQQDVLIEPGQTAIFDPQAARIRVDESSNLDVRYEELLGRASSGGSAAANDLQDVSGWSVLEGRNRLGEQAAWQTPEVGLQGTVTGLAGNLSGGMQSVGHAVGGAMNTAGGSVLGSLSSTLQSMDGGLAGSTLGGVGVGVVQNPLDAVQTPLGGGVENNVVIPPIQLPLGLP